jgi:dimethylglycine dehydrogenase
VRTTKGDIRTPWVINAAGLWAREVAAMAGLSLPLQPTEHQYVVFETMPEIASLGRRLPSVADRDGEYYLRQEGLGLLVGAYERNLKFWAEAGTPADFGHELFDDDLDRIEENMLRAMDRVPALATAGIKRTINGPMIWSPDSAALFGPVPEMTGYFCCCGIIPGFSQSGGLGRLAAEWMIEGEPTLDLFGWDMARYGTWAGAAFTKARVADQYAHRFKIHFPGEERTAGRPVRTRPVQPMQAARGAVFGLNYGWEHPLWFADRPGVQDGAGYARQNWWEPVARECQTLRSKAGIIDISNFAKYEIAGPGAEDWLNALLPNRMPRKVGRSALSPLIGKRGGVAGDFTVTKLAEDRFWMIGSGMAERYHQRFFSAVPLPEDTTFQSLTEHWCGFNVAGPLARVLLQRLTDSSLENADFPFFTSREITLADVSVVALRVSFTGDLGWELHCRNADQIALYDALLKAGSDLGAVPVGSRGLMSLRLEKGYGSWGREYSPEYWPQESGLSALVRSDKDFLNRGGYLQIADNPAREELVILEIVPNGADASGGEPIFTPDGQPIGQVTSGAWGAHVGKSLALGYVKAGSLAPGAAASVAVLGQPHAARRLSAPPFDPEGLRQRS